MLLIIIAVGSLIVLYCQRRQLFQYWKERGTSCLSPGLIFGNMREVAFRTKHISEVIAEGYNKFADKRYFGFYEFSSPKLVIYDLNLIKKICVTDFDAFTDHMQFFPDTSDEFWNKNLFSRKGQNWQEMRNSLTPVFTSSKMKGMFNLMTECGENFVNYLKKQEGPVVLEMRDAFRRFSNDVIASCAFGMTCDSLHDRENEFFVIGKSAFDFSGLKALLFFASSIPSILMKLLNISIVDEKTKTFFRTLIRESIDYREKTGLVRPDLIHMLRQAQKQEQEDVRTNKKQHVVITDEDINVQAYVFFFGGYDTVSVLLCNLAYELAINPDCQDMLIKEIDETFHKCNGKLTYDILMGMKYLDMIISEILRLWPPSAMLNRSSVKPYTVEAEEPGEQSFHIPVGTTCFIPISAIQRDPRYFENPNKFDPERFSDENKGSIQAGSYLPFGYGPRFCIGTRFALLELKVLLFTLLSNFSITPTEKTTIPFVLKPDSISLESKDGYWLKLIPRNEK